MPFRHISGTAAPGRASGQKKSEIWACMTTNDEFAREHPTPLPGLHQESDNFKPFVARKSDPLTECVRTIFATLVSSLDFSMTWHDKRSV
jgi:hypothetical protein